MDTLKSSNINFPIMSGLAAAIFTFLIFIFLSTLSNITIIQGSNSSNSDPVDVKYPEPPPEPTEKIIEKYTIDKKPIPEIKPEDANERPVPPAPDIPQHFTGLPGIPMDKGLNRGDIGRRIQMPVITTVFEPFQVDRKPFIVKRIKPVYPPHATSSGVEGRVILRFVVDENGMVQDPEIFSADPEGIFNNSALNAIVRYKFRPALVGNKPVKCSVKLPMSFELE